MRMLVLPARRLRRQMVTLDGFEGTQRRVVRVDQYHRWVVVTYADGGRCRYRPDIPVAVVAPVDVPTP